MSIILHTQPSLPQAGLTTSVGGWSRPSSMTVASGADLRRPDMPKIEEVSEMDRPNSALDGGVHPSITTVMTLASSTSTVTVATTTATAAATNTQSSNTTTASSSISSSLPSTTSSTSTSLSSSGAVPPATLVAKPSLTLTRVSDSLSDLPSDSNTQKSSGRFVIPPPSSSGRDLVSRSISVPARLPTEKGFSPSLSTSTSTTTTRASTSASLTGSEGDLPVPSWRQGLRKTGSSSMVHEWMAQNDSNALPRSASSPRLALDSRLDTLQERLAARRPMSSIGSTPASSTATTTSSSLISTSNDTDTSKATGDSEFLLQHRSIIGRRNSYTFGQSFAGFRSSYGGRTGGYVPLHLRQQQREAEDREKSQALPGARDRSTYCGPSSVSSSASSSSPSTTNSVFKRSYEPPKRDEETETQRKARARHARQSRRSTQGVSLEDVTKATEEMFGSDDHSKVSKDTVDGTSSSSSTRNSILDREGSSGLGRSGSSVGAPSATSNLSLTTATTTTSSSTSSSISSQDIDVAGQREDRSITSGYRARRALEDRNDSSNTDVPSTRSYRRAREDRDLNSLSGLGSSDVTSSYVPRSQRNSAILLGDSGSSSSQNLLRSSSLRAGRLRNGDTSDFSSTSSTITPTPRTEEDSKRDDSSQEKKEERKEPSAIRARRQRRERRSTGITYDNEDSETSKENKPEEEKKEDVLQKLRTTNEAMTAVISTATRCSAKDQPSAVLISK
ncbi:protein phosphatase 1 regulatory subunit 12A [Elysia marginata]|uniref:Protein phosphatase 1 regulatory subunit 12A n=1 Tax=Elysia marginata TaxID=1093978 RepID=A0AAV4HV23_9GAST|nr:protein phosphatase 1 regulatory subunit 12A [Elysia marginata]